MRRSVLVAAAAGVTVGALLHAAPALGQVAVEQIEALEQETGDAANAPTGYAPVDFNGSTSVTQTTGTFAGITFNTVSTILTNTQSAHAGIVAGDFYGSGSVGNPFTTTVYTDDADSFFGDINPQATTGVGPAPGTFPSGVKVVNNSYVADGSGATPAFSDVDALRRLDYMIATADVTFVTAAVSALPDPTTGGTDYFSLNWSAYDSLAVTGTSQTFDPADLPGGDPGKTHADLNGGSGDASFTTAIVSSDALGLYGNAQAAGQADAQHDVVIRSLLMTGADKTTYTAPFTANHLSVQNGAGTADYASSLAILQAGQQPVFYNGSLTTIGTATPSSNTRGWAYSSLEPQGSGYLTFHSSGDITSITASLNYDVTQSDNTADDSIDTSDAGTIFPDITLEVVPLTLISGDEYAIGSQSDATLISTDPTDNEQYIYFTGDLPAGDYAFEFVNDTTMSPTIGFSYSLTEVPEPASLGAFAAAMMVCARIFTRRRRRPPLARGTEPSGSAAGAF